MKTFSKSGKIMLALVLAGMVVGMSPVAYGQGTQQCTLRAAVTAAELQQLIPGDPVATGDLAAGTVLGPVGSTAPVKTNGYGLICSLGVIKQIADLLFLLVTILSVAAIVYSAYLFLTSAGDPTKTGAAKNWLLYAIVRSEEHTSELQ